MFCVILALSQRCERNAQVHLGLGPFQRPQTLRPAPGLSWQQLPEEARETVRPGHLPVSAACGFTLG
jgi:hypothetical protein